MQLNNVIKWLVSSYVGTCEVVINANFMWYSFDIHIYDFHSQLFYATVPLSLASYVASFFPICFILKIKLAIWLGGDYSEINKR